MEKSKIINIHLSEDVSIRIVKDIKNAQIIVKSDGSVETVSKKNNIEPVSKTNDIDKISVFKEKSVDNNIIEEENLKLNQAALVIDNMIDSNQIEVEVSSLLKSIGILPHLRGYRYIIKAVQMLIEDQTLINSVTTVFYPGIAEVFNSSASKIERAIRHAIEVAFTKGKGDSKKRDEIFGSSLGPGKDKPTNSEFISCIAEKFRLKK